MILIFQALQIFEVLRDVGQAHHSLSAGLLIGGSKNFREEQQRIMNMNVLGRLLSIDTVSIIAYNSLHPWTFASAS